VGTPAGWTVSDSLLYQEGRRAPDVTRSARDAPIL
jgi:hypothetical protein